MRFILMPELKMITLFHPPSFSLIIDELKKNNIKGTYLESNYEKFIIFDTNDDFLLFKLKFVNSESLEFYKQISKDHTYEYFKFYYIEYIGYHRVNKFIMF